MKDVKKFYTPHYIMHSHLFDLDGYRDITAYAQDTETVAMAAMLQCSYNATR